MKKLVILFFGLLCTYYSHSTLIYPHEKICGEQIYFHLPGTGIQISLADFVKLKPSDFKRLKGEKLKWKEVIALKITQKQIKKMILKDGTIDISEFQRKAKEPFKWHWGGFFLGMLVPVGFIITLFIKDKNRKNRITSAIIGMLVASLIGVMIGALIVASSL